VDGLKAEVYQSSRNARIKLFSPTATYKLMNVPQARTGQLKQATTSGGGNLTLSKGQQ